METKSEPVPFNQHEMVMDSLLKKILDRYNDCKKNISCIRLTDNSSHHLLLLVLIFIVPFIDFQPLCTSFISEN